MRGEGTPDDERGPRCSSIVGVAGCPFDRLARRFMDRIIRLVTDPTVKVRRISREVNFLSSQWTLERRGKFLEKIAALVIDLDCARQLAGSALWGSAPELLNI